MRYPHFLYMKTFVYTYAWMVQRINNVIDSCKTKKQLDFARKYCYIIANKFGSWEFNTIENSFENRFTRIDIMEYIDMRIKHQESKL